MRTGYEKGYQVYTLTDCVAATSVEEHENAIKMDYPMFSRPVQQHRLPRRAVRRRRAGGQLPRLLTHQPPAPHPAMTPTAPRSPRGGARRTGSAGIPRFLLSIPVTLLTVGLLLLAGILTGTLFAGTAPNDPSSPGLQFGLPAFREGRIWTLFTGAVTFSQPGFYLVVGAVLAVGLGVYERRVGSLRAAVALVITHTAGIVIPALLLWPFVGSDWTWAAQLGGQLDAGMSAGGFGVAAAATALLTPPWRGRLRVLGTTFLAVLVIRSGLLWDLEHLAGWLAGLAIGPWLGSQVRLVPRAPPGADAGRARSRVLTALIAAGFALSNVVEAFFPGLGGVLGPGVGAAQVRGPG